MHIRSRRYIRRLQSLSGSVAIAIGKHNKPVHNRNGSYISELRDVDDNYVNLYDSADRRAWFVDGASGLLHLVRASLTMDQHDRFPHDSDCDILKRITDLVGSTTHERALKILRDERFPSIKLYNKPIDHEQCEETATEIVTEEQDSSTKEERSGTVTRSPLVGSRS